MQFSREKYSITCQWAYRWRHFPLERWKARVLIIITRNYAAAWRYESSRGGNKNLLTCSARSRNIAHHSKLEKVLVLPGLTPVKIYLSQTVLTAFLQYSTVLVHRWSAEYPQELKMFNNICILTQRMKLSIRICDLPSGRKMQWVSIDIIYKRHHCNCRSSASFVGGGGGQIF